MQPLPLELTSLIVGFAPSFSKLVLKHTQALVADAVPASGKRTVTAADLDCGVTW